MRMLFRPFKRGRTSGPVCYFEVELFAETRPTTDWTISVRVIPALHSHLGLSIIDRPNPSEVHLTLEFYGTLNEARASTLHVSAQSAKEMCVIRTAKVVA